MLFWEILEQLYLSDNFQESICSKVFIPVKVCRLQLPNFSKK